MSASEPGELIQLFSKYFDAGDLEGLMTLYEEEAVFPTHGRESRGPDEIRALLQGYIDSGASLVFEKSIVFEAGDVALVQNAWTMTSTSGAQSEGVTVEVGRRQSDGTWKYIIDSPDGAVLLHD